MRELNLPNPPKNYPKSPLMCVMNGAKGIGGDRKLSEEEMHRYYKAQHEFEQAIENRHYQLTGNRGVWCDAE